MERHAADALVAHFKRHCGLDERTNAAFGMHPHTSDLARETLYASSAIFNCRSAASAAAAHALFIVSPLSAIFLFEKCRESRYQNRVRL